MDSIEYIKQKYYELIPRSFKTKLDTYLFTRCIKHRRIGVFEKWEFNRFKIEEDILESYERAWQLGGNDRLSDEGLTMSEIDKEIENWTQKNQNVI